MSEIRVTCSAADLLPIDALLEFQGSLKTITQDNLDKLKRSILKHGFTAPIFVWKGVDYHILDGHQRLKALLELRQEGYSIPTLPVAYIDADNEAEAKEKLLYITSQYGEFSHSGFTGFIDGLDFSFEDIRLTSAEFFTGGFEEGETDPEAEWDGMPEFDQPGDEPLRSIIVHMESEEAIAEFQRLIGQTFSEKAKYIYHPKQVKADLAASGYTDE